MMFNETDAAAQVVCNQSILFNKQSHFELYLLTVIAASVLTEDNNNNH